MMPVSAQPMISGRFRRRRRAAALGHRPHVCGRHRMEAGDDR